MNRKGQKKGPGKNEQHSLLFLILNEPKYSTRSFAGRQRSAKNWRAFCALFKHIWWSKCTRGRARTRQKLKQKIGERFVLFWHGKLSHDVLSHNHSLLSRPLPGQFEARPIAHGIYPWHPSGRYHPQTAPGSDMRVVALLGVRNDSKAGFCLGVGGLGGSPILRQFSRRKLPKPVPIPYLSICSIPHPRS